jgi:hypothetical protein
MLEKHNTIYEVMGKKAPPNFVLLEGFLFETNKCNALHNNLRISDRHLRTWRE